MGGLLLFPPSCGHFCRAPLGVSVTLGRRADCLWLAFWSQLSRFRLCKHGWLEPLSLRLCWGTKIVPTSYKYHVLAYCTTGAPSPYLLAKCCKFPAQGLTLMHLIIQ